MILQALNQYYNILEDDPDVNIPRLGYSTVKVSHAINLSESGEILDILSMYETVQRGKTTREVPRNMIVPAHAKRTVNIAANFLCDSSTYILGIASENKKDKNPDYAIWRFEDFKTKNLEILSNVDGQEARAVVAFLQSYDPTNAENHPVVGEKYDELIDATGFMVFRLHGRSGFIHQVPQIKRAWEQHRSSQGNDLVGQCLVTGEIAPIARLHPSLKGVAGANSAGASLVGFNARAYESYNRVQQQGMNSPTSEKATFAYTTVLNYLLSNSNPNPKFRIGDTTVVYWAESSNKIYEEIFSGLFGLNTGQDSQTLKKKNEIKDSTAEQRLIDIATKVSQGLGFDTTTLMEGLDPGTRFHVLGLAPNAARISIRFYLTDPFEQFIKKITAHYADMQIQREFDNDPIMIPPWRILSETVSKKSRDRDASPLMSGAVMRSILTGAPYPAALFYQIINRVRADMDESEKGIRKINYVRASIIKAYLTRRYRNRNLPQITEVLCMSLNESSSNPAYLLGRLFAVLEKAQQDAAGSRLNATIKDRYFTSACATPASVFPVLLRLSQHHISKAEYGYANDKRIEKIMDKLDIVSNPIPSHLTLDEQGIFILGYYHQRADFFTKKEALETTEPQPEI